MGKIQAKDIIFSRLALFFILIIVFFLGLTDLRIYLENRKTGKMVEEKRLELEKIKQEKEKLDKEVSRFESPEYLEKILRERFLAKKPGEELLIITEEKPADSAGANKTTDDSIFDKILKFFKLK
ncbi:MAG: hypothetical protein A3H02_03255 [Candidatus Niyogibacteria bacterium RIFCSPLOWO2_12_FULL_41_13]|uniref:Septum formation initiator n=1 Tax=Candidatus Niyogibacteria bacterium RIFCSPLOWO2_12_FULL_41_13 TaxID=1801726 RepID=A0A1G2F043_9BACT|nr:MAG: hypothetical protein A3H02_03255 [Candidatus Niyogibacteria bacterium RIFCSPLOWO2_12_FULL_41_13]